MDVDGCVVWPPPIDDVDSRSQLISVDVMFAGTLHDFSTTFVNMTGCHKAVRLDSLISWGSLKIYEVRRPKSGDALLRVPSGVFSLEAKRNATELLLFTCC